MLFGGTGVFALEAEFLKVSGPWIFGRLRLWLDGVAIGNFDDSSDLASSARWARTFLAASPLRTRPELGDATAQDVFELLYGRFVVPVHSKGSARTTPPSGSWDRDPFVLDDVGESAIRDDYGIVVIRKADGIDRVIAKRFENERMLEACVPSGEVDRVLNSYCSWVDGLASQSPTL